MNDLSLLPFDDLLREVDRRLATLAKAKEQDIKREIEALSIRRHAAQALGELGLSTELERFIGIRKAILQDIRVENLISSPVPTPAPTPEAEALIPFEAPAPPVSVSAPQPTQVTTPLPAPLAPKPVEERVEEQTRPGSTLPAPTSEAKPKVEPAPLPSPVEVAKPAPVIEAVPRLVRAAPKPQAPLTRVAFNKAVQALTQSEATFSTLTEFGPAEEARLKSAILQTRALMEAATALELDTEPLYRTLNNLGDALSARAEENRFFAVNLSRFHTYDIWSELSEAFAALSHAEDAVALVEARELSPIERKTLIEGALAAQNWIFRIFDTKGLGVVSAQQRNMFYKINDIAPDIRVYHDDETMRRVARGLGQTLRDVKNRIEKADKKKSALQGLADVVAALDQAGSFENTLVPAVRHFLEAGNPPSNKTLVDVCLPFREAFDELDDPAFAVLLRNLRERETMLRVKGLSSDPDNFPDIETNDEIAEKQRKVAELMDGKTVLVVGGIPVPEKIKELEKVWNARVMWPATRDSTNVNDLIKRVPEADVVLRLIRWSRHGYDKVLEVARADGKMALNIKAGFGINRLANDIYEQAIRPTEAASA